MAKEFKYVCQNTSCGHIEFTTNGASTTRRCPKCGAAMFRK